MMVLHQYPKIWGLSSLSPFCIKVEVFLKLARIPYAVKVELNPSRAPKGKMPFIRDEQEVLADSTFIIQHLIKKYQLYHLDITDPIEKARSHALKLMVEESLYFALLHSRWVEEDNFQNIKKDFLPLFPKFLGGPALTLIRYNLRKQSLAQGLGRHSQIEINRLSSELISSISCLLGSNEFFSSKRVTYIDATLYSFLVTILKQPFNSHLKSEVQKFQNLCEYVLRIERLTL
jgi:glutathione S-transferase